MKPAPAAQTAGAFPKKRGQKLRKKTMHILIGRLTAILLAGLVFIALLPKIGQELTGQGPTETGTQQTQQAGNEDSGKEQPVTGNKNPTSEKETQGDQKIDGEITPATDAKQPEKEPTKTPAGTGSQQDKYETPRDYS